MKYLRPEVKWASISRRSVICASQVDPSKGFTSGFDVDDNYDEME